MSFLALIVIVSVCGGVSYLAYRSGLQASFKYLIYAICFTIAVIAAMKAFGLIGYLNQPVPKIASGVVAERTA